MQMSADVEGFGMSLQDFVLISRLTERHGVNGMVVSIAAYLEQTGDINNSPAFIAAIASEVTQDEVLSLLDECGFGDDDDEEDAESGDEK